MQKRPHLICLNDLKVKINNRWYRFLETRPPNPRDTATIDEMVDNRFWTGGETGYSSQAVE